MKDAMRRQQERMSISISPADRALIESAAEAAGVPVSAWIVHAAREEARWAVACQITGELAAEVGVTADDLAPDRDNSACGSSRASLAHRRSGHLPPSTAQVRLGRSRRRDRGATPARPDQTRGTRPG